MVARRSVRLAAQARSLDRAANEAVLLTQASRDGLVAEQPAVTFETLATARRQSETAVREWVEALRSTGRLVAIAFDGTTLIPSFQFSESFEPVREVGDVVASLTAGGLSEWAVWRWFAAWNGWVEERPVNLVIEGRFDELRRAAAGLTPKTI